MLATTSIAPAPAAASTRLRLGPRGSGLRRNVAAAIRTATSSPTRAAATGHSAPDSPPFRMRRKNRPKEVPEATPYPMARPGQRLLDCAGLAPPGKLPSPAELDSTIAARHSSAPAKAAAPGRSPPATATATGMTTDTSPDTGATTLIGPAARPV